MREEENKQSSRFRRFMKKRWVFPAIYIASAAIILTGVLWYQASQSATDKYSYKSSNIAGKKFNDPAVEVNKAMENFQMPVKDAEQVVIQKKFYDFSGKKADQEAALVVYKNTYVPNTGIDIGMKNGEAFDVVAAMGGNVTKVQEDSLLGNVIEVDHGNGIVTQYESIKDMKVKVGDQIDQGQVIAKAGQSLFNEKAGTHVHFEIRKDGVAVNPQNFFNKPLSALLNDQSATKKSSEIIDDKQKIDDVNAEENSTNDSSSQDKSKDSTTNDKSTNDGTTNDKSTNDSTTNDKSTNDSTTKDKSTNDSTTKDKSTNDSKTKSTPTSDTNS